MTTSKKKFQKVKLYSSKVWQDDCSAQADLQKRRAVRAENLKKARNATDLHHEYKNSPHQFRMTFAEYKSRHRSF